MVLIGLCCERTYNRHKRKLVICLYALRGSVRMIRMRTVQDGSWIAGWRANVIARDLPVRRWGIVVREHRGCISQGSTVKSRHGHWKMLDGEQAAHGFRWRVACPRSAKASTVNTIQYDIARRGYVL